MTRSPSPPGNQSILTPDLVWLLLSLLVIAVALLLEVRPDQKVAFAVLPGSPLPETCTAKSVFGIECLLCGMTRSQIHLAHGRWSAAFAAHRLGWLAALIIVWQVPYRLLRMSGWIAAPARVCTATATGVVLGLLLLNWLDRCLRMWL